jgi:hypothetical protein
MKNGDEFCIFLVPAMHRAFSVPAEILKLFVGREIDFSGGAGSQLNAMNRSAAV